MSGDEDNRQLPVRGSERLLQFETIQSGHSHIQENAARSVEATLGEKSFRRGEGFRLVAGGVQQAGKSPAEGCVVIHHEHGWNLARHCPISMTRTFIVNDDVRLTTSAN